MRAVKPALEYDCKSTNTIRQKPGYRRGVSVKSKQKEKGKATIKDVALRAGVTPLSCRACSIKIKRSI